MFRLDHEAESAVRQRPGVLDADGFLARLEQLSLGRCAGWNLLALRSGGATEILPTGSHSVLAPWSFAWLTRT